MQHRWFYVFGGAALLGLLLWMSWPAKQLVAPTTTNIVTNTSTNQRAPTNASTNATSMITFATADLPDRDPAYDFTVSLPSTWRVEYLSADKAIQVYEVSTGTDKNVQLFITTQAVSTLTRPSGAIGSATILSADATHPERQLLTVRPSSELRRPTWWTTEHQVGIFGNFTTTPGNQYTFSFAPTVSASTLSSIVASMQTATQ